MIAIVSSQRRDASAFAALCASREWTCCECDSVRAFKWMLRKATPKVILTRRKLSDGYSDDLLAHLDAQGLRAQTNVIVLVEADSSPSAEARQVTLGADHVQRDPVRSDVLVEYLARFRGLSRDLAAGARNGIPATFRVGSVQIDPVNRKLRHGSKTVAITPREVELAEYLSSAQGEVITYQTLYTHVLGRNFRGETSNMRVLLGRLHKSFSAVGADLREHVEVIPKLGYRYRPETR